MAPTPPTYTGESSSLVAITTPALTAALLVGSRWGTGGAGSAATVTFGFPQDTASFDTRADVAGSYSPQDPAGNGFAGYLQAFAPFTGAAQTAAREVLAAWATVAQLRFDEVPATAPDAGTLRFAYSGAPSLGATTFAVSAFPQDFAGAGDTWMNAGYLYPDGWAAGSQNFLTLLHEVGHALGLKHPHDAGLNGSPGWPATPSVLDKVGDDTLLAYSTQNMVMAYNDLPGIGAPVQADFAPTTPMQVDIAAIQFLYGPNLAHNAGDTVYTYASGRHYNETIWDGGGSDTIRVDGSADATISLLPGTWSRLGLPLTFSDRGPDLSVARARPEYTDPLTVFIYDTVTIENASGGGGNDTLVGNAVANRLAGGGGNDRIDGGAGIDTAAYAGTRAGYQVDRLEAGWSVTDKGGTEGTDTLSQVERLAFADRSLALDTGSDGKAGQVAQIIRALFGPALLKDAGAVGLGLSLLDKGMGYADLVAAAVGTPIFEQLAGSRSNGDFVRLVYRNVVGSEAPASLVAELSGAIDGGAYTQATLAAAACQHPLNTQSVELTGLATTGLEYLPAAG